MILSNFFLPLQKEAPKEAEIISHKLMLKAGLVDKSASGLYSWLPLGLKLLRNISEIIRNNLNQIGASELLMPILQNGALWSESGRLTAYGQEMLKTEDRHGRTLIFSPTNEEIITDIFRKYVKSYKTLPLNLYQIHWKFRDEIRPRFGVMRAREFLMQDAYSFDINQEAAALTYQKYYETYLKIFRDLGVTALPVKADNGAIGGDFSHEFHILANSGESAIYADADLLSNIAQGNYQFKQLKDYYAAADDMHDSKIAPQNLITKRGIEVGHIFNFGTKYSETLAALVTDKNGQKIAVNMGSYGIGVSRIVAALIESSHDEQGIIWPEEVAPFKIVINPLDQAESFTKAQEIYQQLQQHNIATLLDDSNRSPGEKFAAHDLIGIPYQIIIGKNSLKNNQIEIKQRKSGTKELISYNEVLEYFAK